MAKRSTYVQQRLDEIRAWHRAQPKPRKPSPPPPPPPHWSVRFLKHLHHETKKRAGRRGIEFTLTHADVVAMWEEFEGCCELSGLPMTPHNQEGYPKRPYVPSLDRIDAKKGYTPENTRLICFAMNVALNTWGEHLFAPIAKAFIQRYDQRLSAQVSVAAPARTALASRRRGRARCAPRLRLPSPAVDGTGIRA